MIKTSIWQRLKLSIQFVLTGRLAIQNWPDPVTVRSSDDLKFENCTFRILGYDDDPIPLDNDNLIVPQNWDRVKISEFRRSHFGRENRQLVH